MSNDEKSIEMTGVLSGKSLIEIIKNKDDSLITCEEWQKCNDKEVKKCNSCQHGLDWDNFNGWQIDLNLGKEAYITGNKKPIVLEKGEYLTIEPGDFALLETEENINLPSNIMGFISVRFKYKKMGLVNISGFHVDPGYDGKLIFSVYNAGPDDIIMQRGKPVFMIFFLTLTQSLEKLDKDIQREIESDNEKGYVPVALKEIVKKSNDPDFSKRKCYKGIPLELISMIQGSSVSLTKNNNRIERLETTIKIYGSIAAGIIIALIGMLLKS